MIFRCANLIESSWKAENTKLLAICDLLVLMLLCPMALQCFVSFTIMCMDKENCRAIGHAEHSKDQVITNLQGFWLINLVSKGLQSSPTYTKFCITYFFSMIKMHLSLFCVVYLPFTKDQNSFPACLLVVNTLIYDFGQNKLSSTHSSRHWLQTFFRVKRREVLSSGPGRIKILSIKSWVRFFYETESEVWASLVWASWAIHILCSTYVFFTFWSSIQFTVKLQAVSWFTIPLGTILGVLLTKTCY